MIYDGGSLTHVSLLEGNEVCFRCCHFLSDCESSARIRQPPRVQVPSSMLSLGKSSNPRAQATKQTVRDREFGGQTGLWIPYKCSTFAIGQLYFTIFYTLLSKFSEHFRINLSLILSVILREKGPRMFKATSATYWQYMAIWAEYRWQMMATYCSLRLTPSMPSSFASSPSERPVDAEQQKRRGLNTKRSNEQNMTQSTASIARIARKKKKRTSKGT